MQPQRFGSRFMTKRKTAPALERYFGHNSLHFICRVLACFGFTGLRIDAYEQPQTFAELYRGNSSVVI
jgi:hypothetical protein